MRHGVPIQGTKPEFLWELDKCCEYAGNKPLNEDAYVFPIVDTYWVAFKRNEVK
jgi:hypothetical protein